ncbi:MAG: hypothetical protein KGL40_06825 [Rhodocyclaceae bacterium]|nr:hypothetical protein [Rhodocyclaceae bacterium]
MSTIDLNQLLTELCAGVRQQKRHNLEVVHQVCGELYRLGSKDFSLATVGRMSEERGGMSRRALYNSTSGDFKRLIQAWASLAEANKKMATEHSKTREAPEEDNNLLRKIDDPALRTLLGYIIAERDRLRGEVKLLKQHAEVVIDRRPLPGHINVTPSGQVIQVMSNAGLSDTEKQALEQAISPEFLKGEGWHEGPHGEILNKPGRKLFDIGFANAIRKVLMS